MKFFNPKTAAERYSKGRPFFHPLIINHIKQFLQVERVSSALDVGCGTGLSSVALSEIAENVIGIDASREMILFAPKHPKIEYLISVAEKLPLRDNEFELITMSQVVHWLDLKMFFAEARRVLKDKGFLVIYDNYFSAVTKTNPEFQIWYQESFLEKYPTPPRNWAAFSFEDTEKEGFYLIKHEQIENTIAFSLESLTDFLLTITNVIAAIEGGNEKPEDVKNWLTENLEPFFQNSNETGFLFNAPVWFLQRAD